MKSVNTKNLGVVEAITVLHNFIELIGFNEPSEVSDSEQESVPDDEDFAESNTSSDQLRQILSSVDSRPAISDTGCCFHQNPYQRLIFEI